MPKDADNSVGMSVWGSEDHWSTFLCSQLSEGEQGHREVIKACHLDFFFSVSHTISVKFAEPY